MKAVRIIMKVVSITLLLSTLICGLYLKGSAAPIDPSSIQFHMTIGVAGLVLGIVTMFLPGKRSKAAVNQ
jgi:hypothetical protein